MRFLSNVLAVIVGLLVFSVLAFFMFAGILALASSDEKVTIKEGTVLHLNLENRQLVERGKDDDLNLSGFPGFGSIPEVGLNQLKTAIRTAKDNDNIKGIYLQSGIIFSGPAILAELRDELEDFKESGKFIVAYAEIYTEWGYFLASVADEIYLNPSGLMEFNGLSSETLFLKGLFEKLEVEPLVFRVGDFKSAVEPFILDKMSEESRLQTEAFLNDINNYSLEKIAVSRSIDLVKMTEINQKMLARKAKDAVELGLIDGLWYEDQIRDLLKEKLDLKEDDKISFINITRINKTAKTKNRSSQNRIAVIVAEGDIVSGSAEGSIGSKTFAEEVRKAHKNDAVKAIVLRVNSPGGSALASEVIWRALSEAQKEKPLIASMSELAASGGYYISAPADTIVAQPNTITGSIGIFGLFFNAQGLLNNKLGITTDVAKTGELSDFLDISRPMREEEKEIFQNQVEEGYDIFLTRVADGRGMSKEAVMEVASGRVWSGLQAKEKGLVDILGGLDKAIEIAAQKAGVADDYRVVYYPAQKSTLERILSQLTDDVQTFYGRMKYGELYGLVQQIEMARKFEGIMMRMPQEMTIK
ncbi:signal peptide peptidase SppA [Pararhodonellum marinum]|uniref:signal peptide peptidase SppA n=1 Tax=Pararhodonellum marinum TaxID=2755358 RepID=UPI00188FF3AA|nr:signal peptide peptidase SppA [Pararhodonellum marinum]